MWAWVSAAVGFVVCATGVVTVFCVVGRIVQMRTHDDAMAAAVALVVALVSFMVGLRLWVGFLRAMARRRPLARRSAAKRTQPELWFPALRRSLEAIDVMSGREFEEYVAGRIRDNGWTASLTRATGDFGVDLIAVIGGRRYAIQCKRHAKPVGVAAVQQVVAGAVHHECSRSLVITNQEFTYAAKEMARNTGCELIGRSRILRTWRFARKD